MHGSTFLQRLLTKLECIYSVSNTHIYTVQMSFCSISCCFHIWSPSPREETFGGLCTSPLQENKLDFRTHILQLLIKENNKQSTTLEDSPLVAVDCPPPVVRIRQNQIVSWRRKYCSRTIGRCASVYNLGSFEAFSLGYLKCVLFVNMT